MLNLIGCAPLQKIVYSLKHQYLKFQAIWHLFWITICAKERPLQYFIPIIVFIHNLYWVCLCGDENFLDIDHLILNQCYKHIHICKTDRLLYSSPLSLNQFQTHKFSYTFYFDLELKRKRSALYSGKNVSSPNHWDFVLGLNFSNSLTIG